MMLELAPKTYKEEKTCADRMKWLTEIDKEISNMYRNNFFKILPLPHDVNLIGGGWVFMRNLATSDKPALYMARGNSHKSGLDLNETFVPTATFTALRIILTLAAQSSLHAATFNFFRGLPERVH
ncbi:hypothetical protein O181_008520 [Austropuccinia psidii MF-1]|uniref:Uncharacterized protein n=1 Tax=Austropuccinia psidii MF-1 TaxID=1389203 RepID=A0A9Q3GIZ1_9BASI|nr:hypothetical protein [Austropuccinia psidii MF-1]